MLILYINSAMSFTGFASEEKSSLVYVFKHCYIERYYVQLGQTAHFDYCFKLKVKNFAHSRIFKDHSPIPRTFQGLKFSFPNSRIFKDCSNPA